MNEDDPLFKWLNGPDGRGRARYWARRYGIAEAGDDVLQDALLRALRSAVDRNDVDPAAFGTTLIKRTAIDLLRATSRRAQLVRLYDEDDDPDAKLDQLDDGPGPEDLIIDDAAHDSLRAVVFNAERAAPRDVSAALAFLTLITDPSLGPASAPQPVAGATPATARGWVALHYSGQSECFPSAGESEDNAMRKRRERAIKRATALLASALQGASDV
jgi:hypothetical protein